MLNHRSFIEKANQILDTLSGNGNILLYSADFADFKFVNYFYGIEKGTELLDAVIDYLREIPEVVYCERVFSDQILFIVFTAEARTDEKIIASYNHFSEAFLSTQRAKYPACNLRFYCGISRMTNHNVGEAIDLANMARMDCKRDNVSTAVLYTKDKLQRVARQKREEKEITLALHEKHFIFYLQPKVDLLTGDIVGAEALARRLDENGTMLYPDTFVPIMEANGSIVELDYMICEQVCAYLHNGMKNGLPGIHISVNLSRLHIFNQETADHLLEIVKKYEIPPELLEFEVTESILLKDFTKVKNMIDKLRAYGFSVSIDDFGSGYTGINIFQELNFNVLKLDRKFLSDDPAICVRNSAIIPAIISIAKKLGIYVVCEGTERADQCRYLLNLGCRFAQGFYFSKAVPPDEFYRTYVNQNGKYPLPFRMETVGSGNTASITQTSI